MHNSIATMVHYLAVKNHNALVKMVVLHRRGGIELGEW
jgi:hypothetical protein